MTEAYQTLDDGTLVDYQFDAQQRITVRAGASLNPHARPQVLQLTPADAVELIRILKAFYTAAPVDLALQLALDEHRRGATHDCGEWLQGRYCCLCGREYDIQDREP